MGTRQKDLELEITSLKADELKVQLIFQTVVLKVGREVFLFVAQ